MDLREALTIVADNTRENDFMTLAEASDFEILNGMKPGGELEVNQQEVDSWDDDMLGETDKEVERARYAYKMYFEATPRQIEIALAGLDR